MQFVLPAALTRPSGTRVAAFVLVGLTIVATATAPAAQASSSQPTVKTDVAYGSDGGQSLMLDVALPPGGGTHPAVVMVHGGEWVALTRKVLLPVAEEFAAEGWVAFTIDFSEEAPRYPREVNDVTTAVSWVRGHASDYGVDPAHIAILGTSSGGNLAAVVGLTGSGSLATGSRVSAIVSWSGPLELVPLVQDPTAGCSGQTCQMRRILVPAVERYLGCPVSSCQSTYTKASADTYIDGSDPPMFLVNSDDEVIPLAQAQDMSSKLSSAGVPNQVDVVPGTAHAIQYARQAVQPSIDFLNRYGTGGRAPAGGGLSLIWWVLIGFGGAILLVGGGAYVYGRGKRSGAPRFEGFTS